MENGKWYQPIIGRCSIIFRYPVLVVFLIIFLFTTNTLSQKVAILTAEKTNQSKAFAEKLSETLSPKFTIVDLSLTESILRVKDLENPINLTNQQAIDLGVSIGCNFFIVIKTDTLRRTDYGRDKYFESYAAFYLVSSKTGRLAFWKLKNFEEDTPEQARSKLFLSINESANEFTTQIKTTIRQELTEENVNINELPEAGSVDAKGLRPPLPYRRLKPKYTTLAKLYSLVATVDVLVDIDANGNIQRTEIVRWAGFGLDESVVETVRAMNWRPADRDGRTLPMRVLLRYNFRNIETE